MGNRPCPRHPGIRSVGSGRYVGAGQDYERSLAIRREIGDKWGTAMALAGLGFVALSTAMYDQAEQLCWGA